MAGCSHTPHSRVGSDVAFDPILTRDHWVRSNLTEQIDQIRLSKTRPAALSGGLHTALRLGIRYPIAFKSDLYGTGATLIVACLAYFVDGTPAIIAGSVGFLLIVLGHLRKSEEKAEPNVLSLPREVITPEKAKQSGERNCHDSC